MPIKPAIIGLLLITFSLLIGCADKTSTPTPNPPPTALQRQPDQFNLAISELQKDVQHLEQKLSTLETKLATAGQPRKTDITKTQEPVQDNTCQRSPASQNRIIERMNSLW